jgi:hypothetical protein
MENSDTPITKQKSNKLFKIFKWVFAACLSLFILISGGLYFFHDRICELVLKEVNNELLEPIQVSEVDLVFWGSFPSLSIDLKDVSIQDRLSNSKSKHCLLKVQNIRLQFNPIDLWNEKYNIYNIILPLYRYRMHENNLTKNAGEMDKHLEMLQTKHGR